MDSKAWGPIKQIAYVVADLDASMRHWTGFAGIGPWTVYRNAGMHGSCRGVDTSVKLHVGLSYQNDVQIELIQVVSKTPSPYQNASGQPLLGLHHIAWHSADLAGDVAKAQLRGMTTAFDASNGMVRVAYMESVDEPGLLLEFIEAAPVVLEGFSAGVKASREWDGVNPILSTYDFEA